MKLVVDANILFSFFKRDTLTRKLVLSSSLELYAPEKVFEEFDKHSEIIIKKSDISLEEFIFIKKVLFRYITIINNGNIAEQKIFEIRFGKW